MPFSLRIEAVRGSYRPTPSVSIDDLRPRRPQKLLHSLNNGGEPRCIDESRLDSIFEVWWPKLEQLLAPFLTDAGQPEKSKQAKEPGGQSEILEELLELARNQQKLLNSPETLMPPRYLEHVLRGIAAVGDISPMAFADLESGWRRLRDIATGLKEGEALPAAALNELIRELDKPIEHILEKAGPRAFPRRLRRVRDEP